MITLCMIVKNESAIIERCLKNVVNCIDSYAIIDTGSTDGTQDIIRKCMSGIRGEVYERPWTNFGKARSDAIELARLQGHDYTLMIDADDVVTVGEIESLKTGEAAYQVRIDYPPVHFYRPHIFKNDKPWRFVGVLHEYSTCDGESGPFPIIEGWSIKVHTDGARAKTPERFREDALVLEQEILKNPLNERNVFYLAQSYRDAGMLREARNAYLVRVRMGGWAEETYIAMLEAARLLERIGGNVEEVSKAYIDAHQFRPHRKEALKSLERYLGAVVRKLPMSNDVLFVET